MIFNEALSIPTLYHSLINPNQLGNDHTKVQDKPFCGKPMHIESPEGDLVACLQSKVTCIFFDTWTPYHCDLETLYHVVLKSPYHWVPQNVKLPEFASYVQEEVEIRSVASEASLQSNYTFECFYCGDCRELYGFCEIEGLL